jgi:predicted transposase YbfD/YdcC
MPSSPISVLHGTLVTDDTPLTPVTDSQRLGLLAALAGVADPRDPRGVRYPLTGMLAVAVMAVCTGTVTFAGMADRVRTLDEKDLRALGLTRAPVCSTLWRLLCRVDPITLGQALTRWLLQRDTPDPAREDPGRVGAGRRLRVVSIDGKLARGTCRGGGAKTLLLSAFDTLGGMVLARAVMATKGGETALFQTVISQSCALLAGVGQKVLFVADAQQTQRANLTDVTELGAHLLVPVKRNQPSVYAKVKNLPWAKIPVGDTTRDVGHGRKETRTVKAVTVATPGGLGIGFETAVRAVRITRTRTLAGSTTRETAYLITTLPAEDADPGDLNVYARLEWHIENRLHYVKDVTLREDEQRARTGNGPAVYSVLREAAIGFHRQAGHTNTAQAIRASVQPTPALITALTST